MNNINCPPPCPPHFPQPDCTCEHGVFLTPWGPYTLDVKALNTNKKWAQAMLLNGIQHCHTSSEAETLLADWGEVVETLKTDVLPHMYFAE